MYLASLNISIDFIENQGFNETMEEKFRGLSTLESIQEAIKGMDKILGRKKNYIMIDEKKVLWPLGKRYSKP